MPRAEKIVDDHYAITCLACGCGHGLKGWTFNGDLEKPTFSPSLLVTGFLNTQHPDGICHSYITDGKIMYLNDSTHECAGKTIELPEYADYDSPVVEITA